MFFWRIVTQLVLLASFASLPALWFLFAGKFDGVSALFRGDLNSVIGVIIETPWWTSLRSTGLVLLTSGFLQYNLPYGLLPRFLPVLHSLNQLLFLSMVAAGLVLICISFVYN
jgi:hypothetical protein